MRLQGSYHARSQQAVGATIEDTATSSSKSMVVFGSSVIGSRRAPNSAFTWWTVVTRSRSVSPGLRRSPLPLGVLVAKRRTQQAEQIVESAISGVGKVTDEVHMARMEVVVATTKMEHAKGEIQTQVASFSMQVDASATKAIEVMGERLQQLTSHTKAQMSCVAEEVTQ